MILLPLRASQPLITPTPALSRYQPLFRKAKALESFDRLPPTLEMQNDNAKLGDKFINFIVSIRYTQMRKLISICYFSFSCKQKMFQDEDERGNLLLTPSAGIFVSNSNKDITIKLSKLEPGWKIKGSNVKVRIGNLVVNSLVSLMI